MKRTVLIATSLIFGSLAFFTSCKEKDTTPVVHIGYYTGDICNAPVHLAMEMGFFKEEFDAIGQKYDLIPRIQANGATVGELVGTGRMDAGTDLAAAYLPQIENGLEVTFTGGYHTGCTKFYVRPDSPINSPADLVGKRVAIPGLSDSAFMNIKRKLEDLGIKTSDADSQVEFIVYSSPDMPVALMNGAIDAIGLHDPVAANAEAQYGLKKIFDIGQDDRFATEYCCQAFVTKRLAKENPQGAAAFTRAILRAASLVQAQPEIVAKLQLDNNFVTGELAANTKILADLDFTPSVSGGQKTLDIHARDLQRIGFLKDSTDIEKFIAESFTVLEGVPDSYEYDIATQTYFAIEKDGTKTPVKF